jgi:hypothetical protein
LPPLQFGLKRVNLRSHSGANWSILSTVKSRANLTLLILVTLIGGCAQIPRLTPTATLPAATSIFPTRTAFISPTPPPEIEIDNLTLLEGQIHGDWTVVGLLENRSSKQLSSILIQVSIHDAAGTLLGQKVLPPALSHLGPEETIPIVARFTGVGTATASSAEIIASQTTSFQRARVIVDDISTTPTEDGGLAILGTIINMGSQPAAVDDFGLMLTSSDGEILGYASGIAWLSILGPRESAPFLALLEHNPATFKPNPYIDATITEAPKEGRLTLTQEATISVTDQGTPFVLGEITNEDRRARWAALLLVLKQEETPLALATVNPPLPLGPGESRAFTASEFPGLRAQLAQIETQPDSLTVEVHIDPRASQPANVEAMLLDLQIMLFEPVGSSLIFRGMVSNPTDIDVETATVMATMRTSTGKLLTAGWTIVADTLAAGEQIEFVLPLSLPAGADPALSEYDIRAAGLIP